MNVRFFAGTKKQFLGLAKHNPAALYFCGDTKELFWGDHLLSDGVRVVATFAELPSITDNQAAEGILYFVAETRNGYVLAPNKLEWLQVIYAPEAQNIDLSDYYTKADADAAITEAIAEIRIPDVSAFITESDLADKGYATESFVLAKILEAMQHDCDHNLSIDLSNYTTKDDLTRAIEAIEHPVVDLTGYATEAYVDEKLSEVDVNVDLSDYYTKAEVAELIPDVSGFATKEELPSVDGLASTTYVDEKVADVKLPEKVSELENDAGYLTEHQSLDGYAKLDDIPDVSNFITEVPAEYVTESELNAKGYITEHQSLDGKADVEHRHDDIYDAKGAAQAVKDELLNGASSAYDTLKELGDLIENSHEAIEALEIIAAGKADKEHTHSEYLTEHQSLAGYATEAFVQEQIDAIPDVDLSEYAKKSELPSVDGLATEQFVADAIAAIEIPEVSEASIYKVDFNAPDFAAATEAYNAGKVLVLTNAAPDVNSYALMNYVSDSYITFTKFLTNRSETYGAFNTYYLSADNTWEVSKEVKISKVEANVEGEVAGQLNTIKINKEIYSIPSVEGLASEAYVDEKFNAIELPEVDLSEYALKSELFSKDYNDLVNTPEIPTIEGLATTAYVDEKFNNIPEADFTGYATEEFVTAEIAKISIPEVDDFATKEELAEAINSIEHPTTDLTDYVKKDEIAEFIKEVPSEYITEEELEAKGYLTEHQSLEGYALKADIPSIDGLASEQFVTDAIDAIEIPEIPENVSAFTNDVGYLTEHQDLSEYAKRDELPSIDGLATEEFVAEAIADIEFPETDLSAYSTTTEMNAAIVAAVEVKADDIPFAESKFVTKSIGEFQPGDDVKDLTVAQIFAKLLGLSDVVVEPEEPDEPEIPDEPDSPIEVAKRLALYSVNMNNELAAVSDTSVNTMTTTEAAMAPTKSGFYQIVDDNGEVIESGYQDLTISSEDTYYIIALPKVIDYNTMVEMQAYDPDDAKWYTADKLPLISDPDTVATLCGEVGVDISHIDTDVYTVWVLEDICTGSQLRYIIKEA